MKSTFVLLSLLPILSTAHTAQATTPYRAQCQEVALAVIAVKARDVAKDHMTISAVTYAAPGGDEFGAPWFLTFAEQSDRVQTPEERAKEIRRNELVPGDILVPVVAVIPKGADPIEGAPAPGVLFSGGVLIARCSTNDPTALESVWWRLDTPAK